MRLGPLKTLVKNKAVMARLEEQAQRAAGADIPAGIWGEVAADLARSSAPGGIYDTLAVRPPRPRSLSLPPLPRPPLLPQELVYCAARTQCDHPSCGAVRCGTLLCCAVLQVRMETEGDAEARELADAARIFDVPGGPLAPSAPSAAAGAAPGGAGAGVGRPMTGSAAGAGARPSLSGGGRASPTAPGLWGFHISEGAEEGADGDGEGEEGEQPWLGEGEDAAAAAAAFHAYKGTLLGTGSGGGGAGGRKGSRRTGRLGNTSGGGGAPRLTINVPAGGSGSGGGGGDASVPGRATIDRSAPSLSTAPILTPQLYLTPPLRSVVCGLWCLLTVGSPQRASLRSSLSSRGAAAASSPFVASAAPASPGSRLGPLQQVHTRALL